MLTDRVLHDALEESVLASIRAGRSSGGDASGAAEECQPCLEEYRNLLSKRQARAQETGAEPRGSRLPWVGKWLGRRVAAATMRAF